MTARITAIIVDDEPLAANVIEEYLKEFPEIALTSRFTKSRQAAEKIPVLRPDLVFLDIQMPVMNGFELLDAITGKHDPYIIFTTAYDQYALRAFEANAVGYLLKPFDRDKFGLAIRRFLDRHTGGREQHLYDGLLRMLREQQAPPAYLERIAIKEAQRIFYLAVSDIVYFEAAGDYVKVFTEHGYHLINDSLGALEQKLAPQQFVRIHRSHIINAAFVQEFIPYFNGEYKIVMRNQETLKMSRNYKQQLSRVFRDL
ncbi:LytR/AlgR family response regulator transcription factor [Taibaiella koreensis]|uniref:LytR/AlgR family response regulator transcription factor n=1 Tax=Taibaiella koreensis TaxID=1268548 RepID=UPI000E59CA70|nr:LytTR family DNA-binding domain-containing protein [Taibaiella koreensis]